MSKYFITGSTGFLGTHLRERLHGNTYLYSRNQDLSCLQSFQPDVIYHLAAEITTESEMIESNISLTYRLLEAARTLPNLKAMIAIGSSSEYGRKDHPISEQDALAPTTMYEATKAMSSFLCQQYAKKYGVPVMVARPFSLYGEHEGTQRLIPTLVRRVGKKQAVSISPGVHDFLHVDDFIDGLFLLEQTPHPGEIYNFGTEVQTSNEAVLHLIEKIMKKKVHINHIPPLHSYDSDSWVADATKAHTLGWHPKYTLETGLQKVIKELQCRHLNYEF